GEVHDAPAVGRGDPRLADRPLPRHRPVEDGRAGGHLVHLDGDELPEELERPAEPVAGDAAVERVERLDPAVEAFPGLGGRGLRGTEGVDRSGHGQQRHARPGKALTRASPTAFDPSTCHAYVTRSVLRDGTEANTLTQ